MPLFFRDSVFIGLVLFGLLSAAIIFFYDRAVDSKIDDAKRLLAGHGKFMAALVDSNAHASLRQPEHSRSPTYQTLASRLQRVRDYYPEIGWLFTGRYQNGGALVIIQTAEPHGGTMGEHYLGQPFELPAPPDSAVWQTLNSNETALSDEPIFEGRSIGAVIPLGSPYNGARDFLYLDLDNEHYLGPMAALRRLRDIGLFVAAIVSLIAGMALFKWRCRIFVANKEPETALQKSEELFRTTFALSPVAMFIASPDFSIRRSNHSLTEFLGYTEMELTQCSLRDYSIAEDLKKELPLIEKLRTRALSHYNMEKRFRRKDGSTVWGFLSVTGVRDAEEELSYVVAQVVDITERKMAEELLRLNEERLALAASAGKVGTWDYDMRSQGIIWNPVMHDMFGTDAKTFAPTFDKYQELLHPDDRAAFVREFQKATASGTPFNMEFRTATTNERPMRYIQADAVIYRDDAGQPIRAVGTNIDITAEKVESAELTRAKEEAQAADRAKSEFLAVMSHELRTPLNGVLGFISLLKNTSLSIEQRGHIDTIESSGEGLLVLIDDILDFSRIESGNMRVEVTAFEMRPFMRDIYLLQKSRAEEKGISFTFDIDPDVPAMIHTDKVRLAQVLGNIVGNALKFTERGRVQLNLAATPLDHMRKNWEWRFTVRDTGPGIPAHVVPNLFKPFYQGDSSSTRRYGGTGLGLAISRRLANLLNGDITVQSWQGAGSEFLITLKAPSSQPSALKNYFAQQRGKTSPAPASPIMKGKRILVVEDNPVNRKLCTLQLNRMGCETDYAETGREAVQKVLDHKFDVILMDMQLPDLDGCSAAREIRERKKDDPTLCIIALTANAMPEDRQKCLDAGMNDYMSKPFKAETLASTLKKWM